MMDKQHKVTYANVNQFRDLIHVGANFGDDGVDLYFEPLQAQKLAIDLLKTVMNMCNESTNG